MDLFTLSNHSLQNNLKVILSKFEFILKTSIISVLGPKAPKNLSVYNNLLVKEFMDLKDGHIRTFDGESQEWFHLRGEMLMITCDVPAVAKEMNRVQQNSLNSCGHCMLKGLWNFVYIFIY